MIIINAHINQISDFDDFQKALLLNEIRAAGVDDFISVGEVQDLLNALETNRHRQILLFTNLSPDHFYKYRGIDVRKFGIKPVKYRINKYKFSSDLYHNICCRFPIVQIHFITSALKRNVNDCDFFNITGGIKTTIKRKQEWMKLEVEYQISLKRYMLNEIYEAKSATSILIPNHEILFRKPVVKFCQN